VTLAIDIGGSGVKAMLLGADGRPRSSRVRVETPRPATPNAVLGAIAELSHKLPGYDRAAAGFPGVVQDGFVRTAANLHPEWLGVNVARRLAEACRAPARVANDADVQGLGAIEGRGVELLITLGTGIGSALFHEGRLVPNLQMGHHPFRKGRTYEGQLSDRARKRVGNKRWNRRLRLALETLDQAFRPRRIYVGGGNARHISGTLPRGVRIVDNLAGLLGGIRLWNGSDGSSADRNGEHPVSSRRRRASKRTGAPVRRRARPR
jgi:polyphosphate glucokinase